MTTHAQFQALADKMIAKHGRTITLVKRSTTVVESDKPWRGTVDSISSATTITKTAVFVSGDGGGETVDAEKRKNSVFLVAGDNTDLSEYQEILDEGKVYRIIKAKLLKPGSIGILWEIEVDG